MVNLHAQIQYDGCNTAISAPYPLTMNAAGTVGARNTYSTGDIGNCGIGGACVFRTIWTGTAWEIQASQDSGATFPIILYQNTTASTPNPPDLTLGTWVDVSGANCGPINTLSGDVQSTIGSSAPEIDVQGNTTSIVDGDVTPTTTDGTDFGAITLGGNSSQTFTIANSGTANLTVNSIALSGAQASDFAVSGIILPATVTAGGNATFTVTFTPGAVGIRNATLTIGNNDADEGTYDFAIEGNGLSLPEVAITEWISNPLGNEALYEWVEIYNYGTVPVDLENWRLRDEGTDNAVISSSSFILQPGAYAILAKNKAAFEADWLTCSNNPNVLEVSMILGNSADEIILFDNSGNLIWQVSYMNDETAGRATWYTENNFPSRQWGTSAAPGIRRNSNDVTTGTLGYQSNNTTSDPLQFTSTIGDIASPLNGKRSLAGVERGNALDFDGVNDIVNLGNVSTMDFDFNMPFSIETWVRVDASTTSNGNFLTKFDGSTFVGYTFGYLGSTGALNFGIAHLGVSQFFEVRSNAGFDIRDGKWHHIAVTYDGSGNATGATIYIDGVNRTTVAAAGTISTSIRTTAPAIIGNYHAGSEFLEGSLDELRVWNSERSGTEIRENMHLTQKGCETGLVAYYQFNEAPSTTTLPDLAGGNNGTLSGFNLGTSWQSSGVNTGNDASTTSNSQTLNVAAVAGTRHATFTNTHLHLELIDNTTTEDYTVTYQAFTPNSVVGASGTTIIQNPVWTINKSTTATAPRMNIRFDYPTTPFTNLDGSKYRLYWRPMNADGPWTVLKNQARTVTASSILFSSIYETGQFMVVQASDLFVSDVRGEMYDFNGVDQTINLGFGLVNTLNDNNRTTFETWVKVDRAPTAGNIFSLVESNDSIPSNFSHLSLESGDGNLNLTFHVSGYIITTVDPVLIPGEWVHCAGVYDPFESNIADQVRIYVNGIRQPVTSSGTSFPDPLGLSENFYIGSQRGTAQFLDGAQDEIRIWTTARTQAEIRENMHLTLKGTEPGLVSYYQFNNDDAVGTTNGVKDAMDANNGTTVNMTAANRLPSEVAVAGGVSERMTVTSTGSMNFATPNVNIDFGSNPNGEIVVSRLVTEKPTGWQSIGSDVDNEYFVIWNYGTNQSPSINGMTFGALTHLNASTVPSDIDLYQRGSRDFGPSWGVAIANANTITPSSPGSATFIGAPLTNGFSQFVVAQTAGSDLPIELVNFNAKRKNATEVALRWTTAVELNNRGFELQRMLEGETNFVPVGWVDGKGTTTMMTHYNFVDDNASTNVTYYRLKQEDFDGSISYSPIRAVQGAPRSDNSRLVLFPNPATNEVRVRLSDLGKVTQLDLQLTDVQGRIWRQAEINLNGAATLDWTTPLTDLAPGVYFITLRSLDGTHKWQEKLILQ